MDATIKFWYFSNMPGIESYNLFGEHNELPDVVHCETIEARSVLNDWEFSPHRHARLHQFLLMESGSGKAQIESHEFDLKSGDLVNLPVGVVHAFRFRRGSQGWVVTLRDEALHETLHDSEGLRSLLQQPGVTCADETITHAVKAIFAEYPTRHFARAQVLRSLSALLAGLVARVLVKKAPERLQPASRLQRQFEALLEAHFQQHLTVSDYARMLAVTSTHLSRVMREATGRPASAAIEERVIREACRLLAFSNLSVSSVAYDIGYTDPSYFSRVFARATGMRPRTYRQRLNDNSAPPDFPASAA
ncbi:MAG: helix-turn-helix domain-containing protein [Burkholderiaceae bacterium]